MKPPTRGDSMEMSFFARFHAREGLEDAVAAALRDVVPATRAEADCRFISAFRSLHDPRWFYVHSRWTDEAAFDRHAALPHTVRFVERIEPLLDHPFDAARTRPLAPDPAAPAPRGGTMPHFKALMTATYPATDLTRAKAWYAEAFGVAPYFDEPFYVGFHVAGYELGLMPAEPPAHVPGTQGVVAFWGTDDIAAAHARLLALGARELAPAQDVGGGILVSTLLDPDGNVLGLIENPQFGR